MQGKIALEEHSPSRYADGFSGLRPGLLLAELKERLLDIQDKRLAQMDRTASR